MYDTAMISMDDNSCDEALQFITLAPLAARKAGRARRQQTPADHWAGQAGAPLQPAGLAAGECGP